VREITFVLSGHGEDMNANRGGHHGVLSLSVPIERKCRLSPCRRLSGRQISTPRISILVSKCSEISNLPIACQLARFFFYWMESRS
jgi:hypothetical protein